MECNAPMRRWRLTVNAIMMDLDAPIDDCEVHIRLGAQVAMVGHTFELPKQTTASFLARAFSSKGDIDWTKEEIAK